MMTRNAHVVARYSRAAVAALALGLAAAGAHAAGAIESVTGFSQGGADVLRIELSEAPAQLPTGFSIQSPARIALDFPGVVNNVGRSAIELNHATCVPPRWYRPVSAPAW